MANKLPSIKNHVENLEDLTIIWLDEQSEDFHTKIRLRCVINYLKIFTELNPCLEYIESVPNEHIFIIVSGQLSSSLIPLIQNLPQILKIYIFCQYPEKYSSLKSNGVFNNQELLYNQLSKDVNQFYNANSTTIAFLTEKSLRDLTKETGAFFWFQLFIKTLISIPSSDEAKQDLLQLARTFYANNDIELNRIDHFAQTYEASDALKWYSSDSFAYRLLNKAIRTENIDLLFACRFFITDLHYQLELLHKPYIEDIRCRNHDKTIVYHGQQMTLNDFAKLKANVGNLISINSFLSTSTDRQVALIYAGDKSIHMESVLFQIEININGTHDTHQHPFADISEFSQFRDECEVLFSLGAMFRVESIGEQLGDVWTVNMIFIESTDETQEMHALNTHLRNNSNKKTTMADLAYLLFFMDDYNRAIKFCQKVLHSVPDNLPLVIECYNIMGQAYRNEPELALQSFEMALKLHLQQNSSEFHTLATIYNNIGFAHRRLSSDKHLVIPYYEKALEMCTFVSDKDQTDWCLIATILNNLVCADPDGDLDLALARERLVLDIRLKYLPLSHPLVAATYKILAEIYSSRGEFEETLIYSSEVLRITIKYLPNGHSSIVDAYSDVALLYLYKGDWEAAEDQKEMSVKSYKKSLELNHHAFDVLSLSQSSSSRHYKLISFLYNNCGVVYIRLGRFEVALDYFNIATTITLPHLPDNDDMHGALLKNKGKVYTLQGNMSKGMEYHNLAIEFYNRIGLSKSLRVAQIYFNIAEWYELSEQRDSAVEYYKRSSELVTDQYKSSYHKKLLLLQCTKALNRMQRTI